MGTPLIHPHKIKCRTGIWYVSRFNLSFPRLRVSHVLVSTPQPDSAFSCCSLYLASTQFPIGDRIRRGVGLTPEYLLSFLPDTREWPNWRWEIPRIHHACTYHGVWFMGSRLGNGHGRCRRQRIRRNETRLCWDEHFVHWALGIGVALDSLDWLSREISNHRSRLYFCETRSCMVDMHRCM